MEDCYVVLTLDSVVKILWCDQSIRAGSYVHLYRCIFVIRNYLILFSVNFEFNKLFFVNL